MTRDRGRERGLSLIEVLVATAVLCLVMVVALTLYDESRKAFAKGENATESQESVRIAFDRLSSDLRMLGYNVNPDGNPNRPDEQLEGALDHAVILRADFDRSDPAAAATPETALAGGVFSTVSTGNDEIVAYVLAKPDGTGPDTLSFEADVAEPARDGVVERVSIDNVVLDPVSPPYTLYRVTLNNNAGAYGSASFIVRTPVVENVRDLSFVYYDARGTFKDPSSTILETDAAKAVRSGLTRVNVSLVGMTRQKDLSYNDVSDAAAPQNRKFELKGDITPRNMRFKGIPDLNADLTPPSKPAAPTLAPGHCRGLIVAWAPNAPSEGVTQYRIYWGPSGGGATRSRNVPGSPFFLDGLADGTSYAVTVQAQDVEGNVSALSDPSPATTANINVPSAPTALTTSTDQLYQVMVSWAPVTTNASSVPAADPQAPRIRDLAGYRLYWDSDNTVPMDPAHLVADERVLSAGVQPPFYDTPVVACQDRWYVMTAVDTCGRESAPARVSLGRATDPRVKPDPPEDAQAQYVGPNRAHVKWKRIPTDQNGQTIKIDRYEVYRSAPVDGTMPAASAVWSATPLVYGDSSNYDDTTVPGVGPGQVVYYRIAGVDECGNRSDFSNDARLECTFTGEVTFVTPADDQLVSGSVPVTVSVLHGTDAYVGITITYELIGHGVKRTFAATGPGPTWTDNGWNPSPLGTYKITATVQTDLGCSQMDSIEVTATVAPQ